MIYAHEMQSSSFVAEARHLYAKASNHADSRPGTLIPLRTKGEIEFRDVTGEPVHFHLGLKQCTESRSRFLHHQGACESCFDDAFVRIHENTATMLADP